MTELSPKETQAISAFLAQEFVKNDDLAAPNKRKAPPPPVFAKLSSIKPEDIPPLKWIIRDFLLVGKLAMLGGAGGAGKSLMAWAIAASVAGGKAFAGFEEPERPRNVVIISGEDDGFEVARRIAAHCAYAGISYEEISDRITILAEQSITLAINDEGGGGATSLCSAARALIEETDAGLIIVDPLVAASSGYRENDNDDMEQLFVILRDLVAGTDCAGLLIDHFNKAADASTAAAIRGASSKVAAARLAATLSVVTETEYKKLRSAGLLAPRESVVVLMVPKSNYGPKPPPQTFQLIDRPCGNGETRPVFAPVDNALPLFDVEYCEFKEPLLKLMGSGEWRTARSGPADRRLDLEMEKRFDITLQAAWRWLDSFEADKIIQRAKRDGIMRYELTKKPVEHAAVVELVQSGEWRATRSGPAKVRLDLAIVERFGISKEEAHTLLDALEAEGVIRRVERKDAKSRPYTAYEAC